MSEDGKTDIQRDRQAKRDKQRDLYRRTHTVMDGQTER